MSKRVCVIGGGISGLCVAYRLHQAGADVVLFEKSSSVGGNIKTERVDGFLIEHGPNSTLTSRDLLDLVNDLGFVDEIEPPNSESRKRYVLIDGRLVKPPSRIIDLVGTRALSLGAKLRLLKEPFIRSQSPPDETVCSFFERRFGKEIVDRVVDPFVSGIYAGDPAKLSIRHAFPRLIEFERNFGSVLAGALLSRPDKASRLPKGTPRSLTFKNGMQTLTNKLQERLTDKIRLGISVGNIRKDSANQITVRTDIGGEEVFDAVVISTPAHAAARLLVGLDMSLSQQLLDIYYPPIAIVYAAFKSSQVKFDTSGFGFLVPGAEHRNILGSLWTSSVFRGRVPKGSDYRLFTTFVGGSRNAEFADKPDDKLIQTALDELAAVLGLDGEPAFAKLTKWQRAIPQYNVGYEKLYAAIDAFRATNQRVFFCSNFYKGISVSDCVKNSVATTNSVLDLLES